VHALTIVCPVDYSDCSKRALRFAGALADHFRARLVVLHVFDPLLAGTAALHQFDLTGTDGQRELQYFVEDHLPAGMRDGKQLECVLVAGSPGREILRVARSHDTDLLVMGTHGFSGVRKAIFGSTLQGVLRRARVPVLAVPILDHREVGIQAPLISTGPVLAPVDFSPESRAAARVAVGLARALGLPLLLLHAITPPNPASPGRRQGETLGDRTQGGDPAALMTELGASLATDVRIDSRIVHGEPAEQIARLAREKLSAVIVMSLGSSAMRRRKPGSIAYRVLCLAPVPVLALPETPSGRLDIQYLNHGVSV
jgi:universal stress protein A